ncbi:MAG: hypothetical protein AB7F96_05920 [Beijerinckiaceae bacterium]
MPPLEAPPIRWINALWLALSIAAMAAVIVWGNLWALNFLHVAAGLLWTGIDLFMGFVIGPVLRQVPFEARRAVMTRITPKTMFILPGLAIITGTTGWYLAQRMGYLDYDWPGYAWVLAALIIVTILTIQGIGYLLPTQIRVYLELRKPQPDIARIARLSRAYFWVIASQGMMQVLIVVIMAKFRTGV